MAFADQLCDVRLLGSAMGWAAQRQAPPENAPQLQIFNIDNGDVVTWVVSATLTDLHLPIALLSVVQSDPARMTTTARHVLQFAGCR